MVPEQAEQGAADEAVGGPGRRVLHRRETTQENKRRQFLTENSNETNWALFDCLFLILLDVGRHYSHSIRC